MSNILAISVALKSASVALEHNGQVYTKNLEEDTPTYFVGFVADFLNNLNLKFCDLDKLIVAGGPGSFTGLRVGISFAKALHELTNIEVICVSYFDVLRALYADRQCDLMVINSENPNEFYYQKSGESPNIGLVDEGIDGAYKTVICEPNDDLKINCEERIICADLKSAKHLLLLKNADIQSPLSPLYIKPPYTER